MLSNRTTQWLTAAVLSLASVFAHSGVYTSPSTFVDHFKDAVWVGAAFSAVGILAAAALPARGKGERTAALRS